MSATPVPSDGIDRLINRIAHGERSVTQKKRLPDPDGVACDKCRGALSHNDEQDVEFARHLACGHYVWADESGWLDGNVSKAWRCHNCKDKAPGDQWEIFRQGEFE